MKHWYSWVLAPVMIAAAVIIPATAAPTSPAGHVLVYVLPAILLIATLLLLDIPQLWSRLTDRGDAAADSTAVDHRRKHRRLAVRSGPRADVVDAVMGSIQWHAEEEMWAAGATRPGLAFRILIAGDGEPDARLLPHARDLFSNPSTLLAAVPDVLNRAALEIPDATEEILGLHVESVSLFWPDAPDDGMVYFDGPSTDERVWRCDYRGRRLQPLGFDD